MRGLQAVRNLNSHVQQFFSVQWRFLYALFEYLPLQVLHYDERLSLVLVNVVDHRNVWMIQRRSSAGFPPKSLQGVLVRQTATVKELSTAYRRAELL
jgi:hypothetical protein